MSHSFESLTSAGVRTVQNMDKEDLLALKLCVLSTGVLGGLAIKGSLARRLAATACTFLTAGLAIPIATQYMDELGARPIVVEQMADERLPRE